MKTHWNRTKLVTALIGLAWAGACSDTPCATCPRFPTGGLVISNPVPVSALSAAARGTLARASGGGDEAVFVSLGPGTVPGGSQAFVRRVGDAGPMVTTVIDGGFDPIPLGAQPGDSIDIVVKDGSDAIIYHARAAVAATRPPVVVRTEPPPRKRDVPLNAAMVVVFSEPVAGASLASSIHLFRGTTGIAGTVELLQGVGAAAAFVPSAPLAANTDYRLEIARGVRDLDGDDLSSGVTVAFTTGQSSTGPAASIKLSPDTVYMTGVTYQMTATVRDGAGNELVDQPIAWSTSDPNGLTVSPTGLLTGLVPGNYEVTATVNGAVGRAGVLVIPGPPSSVTISPVQATLQAAGDTISLVATVRDVLGRPLMQPTAAWTSSDLTLATVKSDSATNAGQAFATVTGVSPGSVEIVATSGATSDTASVTVIAPLPVASVTVTPAAATLVVQGKRQLTATVTDANGKVLAGRSITWTTDNAAVATVDASGLVTGVGQGSASVITTSEGVSDTAAITVTAISFASVSAGFDHTCGITTANAAYCWGDNGYGQLGDGQVRSNGLVPVEVVGGLSFAAVSSGGFHTCAITTGGSAYCWGANYHGELGDGSNVNSPVPVAVTGGLRFTAISAGDGRSCGITSAGAAYCWGANQSGELGDGTTTDRAVPVPVLGGLNFVEVSTGGDQWLGHTCGVTTGGAAFCWGNNQAGELGDGTTSTRTSPVAVLGGLTFVEVRTGGRPGHTCGVTSGGAAYCWGDNRDGQLGDGTTTNRQSPVAVLGGLNFATVTVGGDVWSAHSCGITTGGAAYCWGLDSFGELGDGGTFTQTSPVAVLGGLSFVALSAGGLEHTCGVAAPSTAYCWGRGGLLGDGTFKHSSVPVKVAGQP